MLVNNEYLNKTDLNDKKYFYYYSLTTTDWKKDDLSNTLVKISEIKRCIDINV